MFKSRSRLILMVVLVVFSFSTWANAFVVGTVDIMKVLTTVAEGKRVRDQLEKEFKKKQNILKTQEEKIQKAQNDFLKKQKIMNETARQKKEDEIRQQIMSLQAQKGEFQKDIQETEAKLKKPMFDKLKPIINEISKKVGVDVTFEASSSPIVYAKQTKDITDQVIKMYDQKHK